MLAGQRLARLLVAAPRRPRKINLVNIEYGFALIQEINEIAPGPGLMCDARQRALSVSGALHLRGGGTTSEPAARESGYATGSSRRTAMKATASGYGHLTPAGQRQEPQKRTWTHHERAGRERRNLPRATGSTAGLPDRFGKRDSQRLRPSYTISQHERAGCTRWARGRATGSTASLYLGRSSQRPGHLTRASPAPAGLSFASYGPLGTAFLDSQSY